MELGKKISTLRKEAGFSQEQLAERLGVSRSAIAKWESEKGIPDIENLVALSDLFAKSTDYFLKETEDKALGKMEENIREKVLEDKSESEHLVKEEVSENENQDSSLKEYMGKRCDILLDGWNDGAYNIIIVGFDDEFIFYRVNDKKKERYGAIAKTHITGIELSKKQQECEYAVIEKEYFLNRHVTLELAKEKGLIKGFFDFRDDDYMDVIITSFEKGKIDFAFGKSVSVAKVTKIEER